MPHVALFHAQWVWKWSFCLKMASYCWCIKFWVERNCKQTSPIVSMPSIIKMRFWLSDTVILFTFYLICSICTAKAYPLTEFCVSVIQILKLHTVKSYEKDTKWKSEIHFAWNSFLWHQQSKVLHRDYLSVISLSIGSSILLLLVPNTFLFKIPSCNQGFVIFRWNP